MRALDRAEADSLKAAKQRMDRAVALIEDEAEARRNAGDMRELTADCVLKGQWRKHDVKQHFARWRALKEDVVFYRRVADGQTREKERGQWWLKARRQKRLAQGFALGPQNQQPSASNTVNQDEENTLGSLLAAA